MPRARIRRAPPCSLVTELTAMTERMHIDEGVDGSAGVSEVYLRRDTSVSGAFLQRRKSLT